MVCNVFILLTLAFKICYGSSGVFWQISDVHLNTSHKGEQQSFGNYLSDSSISLLKSALSAMKRLRDKPDFIIWNGDNVAHMNMNDDAFFKTIKDVSQEFYDHFPNTIILPSLGNHDLNPSDQINESSAWCKKLFTYWQRFLINSTYETFKRGCYYSRIVNLDNENIKVIVLNTVLWYSKNQINIKVTDPFGQFQWIKDELQDARNKNLKVFIIGHVPPGASEYTPQIYRHLHPRFNRHLLEILQNNSDVIEAGFFSHQHTDSFKIVYSIKGTPLISLFLSPSVTPMFLQGLGSVNPSIRLYTWPRDKKLRFYSQFITKLPEKNIVSKLNWFLEYKSTDMLPSLSALGMDLLLTEFASQNSSHFHKYFTRHLSGRNHDSIETCALKSVCRCHIICAMRNIDYSLLEQCLKTCNNNNATGQVPMIVSVIVLFTVILIAVILGVNKVYCHQRRSSSLTRDIFMATYNGKDCEQIVADHIDHIAEVTFGDVPEYRGHMRNNSRTILTLNDGNDVVTEKSQPSSISKFAISNKKSKSQEKYDYSRM